MVAFLFFIIRKHITSILSITSHLISKNLVDMFSLFCFAFCCQFLPLCERHLAGIFRTAYCHCSGPPTIIALTQTNHNIPFLQENLLYDAFYVEDLGTLFEDK